MITDYYNYPQNHHLRFNYNYPQNHHLRFNFNYPNYSSFTPMGWQCPKCGFVYAPTWMVCSNCNTEQEKVNESTDDKCDNEKVDNKGKTE